MKIRAVIFDLYGTLLAVGPPPPDAETRWEALFHDSFGDFPRLTRLAFSVACNQIIARRHAAARACGIAFPEVLWPSVLGEVLPEYQRLDARAQAEFQFRQMQIGRTTRLMSGVADTLRWLKQQGCLLGIASNAQAYSVHELETAFSDDNLTLDLFERDLGFLSFEHGYSKPDPHVFQYLASRLEARGISARETLMVGDRLDKDIEPAHKYAFQSWQLCEQPRNGLKNGNWEQLRQHLEQQLQG